jgi:hypothetical protein
MERIHTEKLGLLNSEEFRFDAKTESFRDRLGNVIPMEDVEDHSPDWLKRRIREMKRS